VVGEDPERAGGREVTARGAPLGGHPASGVAAAGELLAELDHRPEAVGLVHGRDVLDDRGHPLEAHPGVDVLLRQRRERVALAELVLHEDEVPELEEALGVVARAVVLAAEAEPAVEVELRARPGRPDRAGLPEVVLAPELDDPLVRDADRAPALDRLLVRPEPELLVTAEDRDPDPRGVEAEALRSGDQLPGELDRALLEVVADGEVAEHLEERQMARGRADDLDVGRAEGLLARAEPPRGRILLAAEVRLEGLHPGGREQHRRVVGRRHERCGGHPPVPPRLEELQEFLADLRRRHPDEGV
jgi:hypothetical protein